VVQAPAEDQAAYLPSETTTVVTVVTHVTKVRLVAVAVAVLRLSCKLASQPTELLLPVVAVVPVLANTEAAQPVTEYLVLPELPRVVLVVQWEVAMALGPEPVAVASSVVPEDGWLVTTGLRVRRPNGMEPVVTPEPPAAQLDQLLPTTCLEQPGTVR
jgi:hypothetical protein